MLNDETGQTLETSIWNALTNTSPGDESASIDMTKGDSAWIRFQSGSNAGDANETVTCTLLDSADNATFAAVSGWSTVVMDGDTDGQIKSFYIKRGQTRRYVAVQLVKSGGGAFRVHSTASQPGVVTGSTFPTVTAPTA